MASLELNNGICQEFDRVIKETSKALAYVETICSLQK